LLPVFVLLMSLYSGAQEVGTLTLLTNGPLHVIRGVNMQQGVEGMRLRQGDILETGPAPLAQAQLEFNGGAVVELGPSSQLYIMSQSSSAAELVLLAGWLKGETTAGVLRYSSPLLTATTKGGNVVFHTSADAADVFAEQGAVSVVGGATVQLASSSQKVFLTRRAGKAGVASGPPPPREFVESMPICFRDVLPPRISAFAGKKQPMPKADHDVSYAEVEHWLMLPAAWRKGFAARFKPRLQDSAFRQAVEAHLSALPDWRPVLHPEATNTGSEPAGKP
jgi:hypothetical protein